MTAKELQEEEREVLLSIYEGDDHFFDLKANSYQYKIGNDGELKSILIDITWGENYPNETPTINLDVFYNKHITESVKSFVKQTLLHEAESLLGGGSTYTLFEYAKENRDMLLEAQPETPLLIMDDSNDGRTDLHDELLRPSKQKKEQLTKNQKRRMYDKFGTVGMMEGKQRGWDWVDVIKHLSQTGGKTD